MSIGGDDAIISLLPCRDALPVFQINDKTGFGRKVGTDLSPCVVVVVVFFFFFSVCVCVWACLVLVLAEELMLESSVAWTSY